MPAGVLRAGSAYSSVVGVTAVVWIRRDIARSVALVLTVLTVVRLVAPAFGHGGGTTSGASYQLGVTPRRQHLGAARPVTPPLINSPLMPMSVWPDGSHAPSRRSVRFQHADCRPPLATKDSRARLAGLLAQIGILCQRPLKATRCAPAADNGRGRQPKARKKIKAPQHQQRHGNQRDRHTGVNERPNQQHWLAPNEPPQAPRTNRLGKILPQPFKWRAAGRCVR